MPSKKSRLALVLLGCFAARPSFAIETYPGDPGTLGVPASWRTAEFLRDWGCARSAPNTPTRKVTAVRVC